MAVKRSATKGISPVLPYEEVKKLAADAVKATGRGAEERSKAADTVSRFSEILADGFSARLTQMKQLLIEQDSVKLAAELPRAEVFASHLRELEVSAREGGTDRAKGAQGALQDLMNKLRSAQDAVNETSKRQDKETRKSTRTEITRSAMATGGGKLPRLFADSGFNQALNAAAMGVPMHPHLTFRYPGTTITKPGTPPQGLQIPVRPEELEALSNKPCPDKQFEDAYCRVGDLPQKIVAPISSGVVFDIELTPQDFLAKPVILGMPETQKLDDGSEVLRVFAPDVPADLSWVDLLGNWIHAKGELRYFYRQSFSAAMATLTSPEALAETGRETVAKNLLLSAMTYLLLYAPPAELMLELPAGSYPEESTGPLVSLLVLDPPNRVLGFRSEVLGWGTQVDGVWQQDLAGPSVYQPSVLPSLLLGVDYNELHIAVDCKWEELLAAALDALQYQKDTANDKVTKTEADAATNDDKKIYDDAVLVEGSLLYGESLDKPLKKTGGVVHVTLKRRNFMAGGDDVTDVKLVDPDFAGRIIRGEAEYNTEKPKIKAALNTTLDSIAKIKKDDWYMDKTWRYSSEYWDFIQTVKSQALKALGVKDEEIQALKSEINSLQNRARALTVVRRLIPTGTLYSDWVRSVCSLLSNSCETKRVVSEAYLPLVLAQQPGAYGEPRKQPYFLRRIGYDRQLDFWQPLPRVGLLKEHRLEVRHRGFGLGNHLYSTSLFPGEKVDIEMKTTQKDAQKVTESSAENIFEEAGSETLNDFSRELRDQLRSELKSSESSTQDANVSTGGLDLGFFSIGGASYGGKWTSQQDETTLCDHTESLLNKLSTRLTQKKTVSMDQKRVVETDRELDRELKTTRSYANDNKEKCLTVNFFQITREFETDLYLDDLKFFYTSGAYPILKVYVAGSGWIEKFAQVLEDYDVTEEETGEDTYGPLASIKTALEKFGVKAKDQFNRMVEQHIIEPLPPELSDRFLKDSLVIVLAPPFSLRLPLGETNAFLAATFVSDKARDKTREISEAVWRIVGGGQAAPGGLAVCAFPFDKKGLADLKLQWPCDRDNQEWPDKDPAGQHRVCDVICLAGSDVGDVIYLPDIDLRYKTTERVPSPYTDPTADGFFSLPKLVWFKKYVINTNGVYAENMLGRCSAFEEYLRDHRDLDVKQKSIEVSTQELELRWLKRRDGITDEDKSVDKSLEFADRLALEKAKLEKEKAELESAIDRVRAMTPPNREDFASDEAYEKALANFQRIQELTSRKVLVIESPEKSVISVIANIDSKESPTVDLKVAPKSESDA